MKKETKKSMQALLRKIGSRYGLNHVNAAKALMDQHFRKCLNHSDFDREMAVDAAIAEVMFHYEVRSIY